MADRTLRLTVAAVADRSLSAVVQPLVDSVHRAQEKISSATRAMGDGMRRAAKDGGDPLGKAFDQAAARAQKAYKQIEEAAAKAAAKEAADAERSAQTKVRAEQRAWDQRLRASKRAMEEEARARKKAHDDEERAILRDVAAYERAAARREAADKRAANSRAKDIVGTGGRAVSNIMGAGRAAAGFAGQVASGMGVSFDIGGSIGRGVALESRIVDIINQAKLGGQDPGADARGRLTKLTRDVADENGLSANAAANVLGSFQGFSSDLAGGEAVLGRLGKLAKATGTDFSDMGAAAGRVNAQLMSMPEYQNDAVKRGDALMSIMRHITKQTADGSVEMSDFSKYIGRIAASANFFAGSFEENVGQLGAMAQMAMKGGASTASEATGSAAAFARDVRKHKTQAKWEAQGINIFADKGNTKLKSPQQLILEYLAKEGASQKNLAELFPNVVSQRAVQNSIDIFSAAGGGQKGLDAVKAEFAKFQSTIGEGDVNKLAGEKMNTTESKAQVFQNQLDRIAASMAERVLPAMEKLAPKMIMLADALSNGVVWISQHLGESIAIAVTASIAKAALGEAVKKSLETTIAGLLTKGGGGAAGGASGVAGALGTAALVFTIAMATFEVGKAVINAIAEEGDKGVNKAIDDQVAAANALSEAAAAVRMEREGQAKIEEGKRKGGSEGDALIAEGEKMVAESKTAQLGAKRHLEEAKGQQEGAAQSAKDMDWLLPAQVGASYAEAIFSPLTALMGGVAGDKSISDLTAGATNKSNEGDINASLVHINATLQALNDHLAGSKPKGGPMEVTVTNMPTASLVGGNGIEGIPPP